ncbi:MULTISPECIES: hypothetical protein [unclassified Saccharibacter]|uniref:hypothetical protein n=1 Tax=unclassified Saccharibacter TaxID=2648722 RepID=UPI00132CB22D|nr:MULTISPECIES: hypothetical protein [unclassified Saccharibacter]MXV35870.1 hypothetical protein [Saccharibacter sp. EH611]MXV57990.1 hypothetical protein [Saccharibacter sp. EH70]MXV66385.1 hypothetical protein [Saccharibacter sp. EH60]
MIDTENFTKEQVISALYAFFTGGKKVALKAGDYPFELRNVCARLYADNPTTDVSKLSGTSWLLSATKQGKGIAPILKELIDLKIISKGQAAEMYIFHYTNT